MNNPYDRVMQDALNSWQRALQPSSTTRLPEELQVRRYEKEHRNDPKKMGEFFKAAVQRGDLTEGEVDRAMDEYVKSMEKVLSKRGGQMPPMGGMPPTQQGW